MERQIVAALRSCNYDPAGAVGMLLEQGPSPPPPPPKATPAKGKGGAALTPAKKGTPQPPQKGGGAGKATPGASPLGRSASTGPPASGSKTSMGSKYIEGVAPAVHHHEHAALPAIPEVVSAGLQRDKPRLSIVCCGHVDAGKSTMMGHLLYDVGCVRCTTRAHAREPGLVRWMLLLLSFEDERGVSIISA